MVKLLTVGAARICFGGFQITKHGVEVIIARTIIAAVATLWDLEDAILVVVAPMEAGKIINSIIV